MTMGEFIHRYAVACGGDWGAMFMSAIRNGLPDVYAEMDDNRAYTVVEMADIIEAHI